jgi:enoyl-CoA hydratase/carnithine racemase
MRSFDDYKDLYSTIAMERSEGGILELTFRTVGHPSWVFTDTTHSELGAAFQDVASDRENRVVIITGSGNRFCADIDYSGFIREKRFESASGWDQIRWDGTRMLTKFMEIEAPVIAAINGPAASHSELPLLADIVLASDTTVFADSTHIVARTVPGDGMQVVWSALMGANRASYFLLTGQEISAQEALDLGVVNEVMPPSKLMTRARELAADLAKLRPMTLQATRRVLTTELRRRLLEEVPYGLSMEALAALDNREHTPAGGAQSGASSIVDLMPHHPH